MTIWSYNSWAEGINLAARRPTFYEQRAEVEKVKKKGDIDNFFLLFFVSKNNHCIYAPDRVGPSGWPVMTFY